MLQASKGSDALIDNYKEMVVQILMAAQILGIVLKNGENENKFDPLTHLEDKVSSTRSRKEPN